MKDHPEYNEYATCYRCGFKKYCKLEGRNFVCYSCSYGNYNGLKAKGLTKGVVFSIRLCPPKVLLADKNAKMAKN